MARISANDPESRKAVVLAAPRALWKPYFLSPDATVAATTSEHQVDEKSGLSGFVRVVGRAAAWHARV
jgi:hypothetical protein